MSGEAEHIAPATAEPPDPLGRLCKRENTRRVAHSICKLSTCVHWGRKGGETAGMALWGAGAWGISRCKLPKRQVFHGEKRMKAEGKMAGQGKRLWGQALTVVPEGWAAGRQRWSPACRAFAAAGGGLGALHPLMAALLGGTGRPGGHPRAFAWGSGPCGCPSRSVGHLLPQGLLGRHDLLALSDEGTLVAQAELPAAVAGVALHRHHEAMVTAAGALGCP